MLNIMRKKIDMKTIITTILTIAILLVATSTMSSAYAEIPS